MLPRLSGAPGKAILTATDLLSVDQRWATVDDVQECTYRPLQSPAARHRPARQTRAADHPQRKMTSHINVRILVSPNCFEDWPGLLSFLQEAFAYMTPRIDPPSSLQRLDAEALRLKASREHLILAVDSTAVPATQAPGMAAVLGCAYADVRDSSVYVGKVAVAQQMRGQGVARQLMQAAEALAQRFDKPFLELETRIELIENHRSFGALGFVKVAEKAHPGYSRPTSITMRRPVPPKPAASATL